MDGFGEVATGGAAAMRAPAVRPQHEPEVLLAAAAAAPARARRTRRPLLIGLAASAAVHGLLLAGVIGTRVGRSEVPPPPPVFLELPAPFPLPMTAGEQETEATAEAAPAAPSPIEPTRSPERPRPSPAASTLAAVAPTPARTVEPVAARPVVQAPAPVRTEAPAAPAPSVEPVAPPTPPPPAPAVSDKGYEGRIMARLAQAKRYPPAARARREEGVAEVRFTVSRQGRVSAVSLARSSGSPTLDREAMDTVRRAQPLPPVPAGMPAPMRMTLGVAFTLR